MTFSAAFALWVYVPSLMMGPSSGVWNPFLLSGWGEMQTRQMQQKSNPSCHHCPFFLHTAVGRGTVSKCQLVSGDFFDRKPVLLGNTTLSTTIHSFCLKVYGSGVVVPWGHLKPGTSEAVNLWEQTSGFIYSPGVHRVHLWATVRKNLLLLCWKTGAAGPVSSMLA